MRMGRGGEGRGRVGERGGTANNERIVVVVLPLSTLSKRTSLFVERGSGEGKALILSVRDQLRPPAVSRTYFINISSGVVVVLALGRRPLDCVRKMTSPLSLHPSVDPVLSLVRSSSLPTAEAFDDDDDDDDHDRDRPGVPMARRGHFPRMPRDVVASSRPTTAAISGGGGGGGSSGSVASLVMEEGR